MIGRTMARGAGPTFGGASFPSGVAFTRGAGLGLESGISSGPAISAVAHIATARAATLTREAMLGANPDDLPTPLSANRNSSAD